MDLAGSSPATVIAAKSNSSNLPADPAILAVGPSTGPRRGRGGRRGNAANPRFAGPSVPSQHHQSSLPLPLITDQPIPFDTTPRRQRCPSLRSRGQGPRARPGRFGSTDGSEDQGAQPASTQTSIQPRGSQLSMITVQSDIAPTMPGSSSHEAKPRPRGGFRGGFRGRPARCTADTQTVLPNPAPLSVHRDAVELRPKPAQPKQEEASVNVKSGTESVMRVLQALREIPRQVKQQQSVQQPRPLKIIEEESECQAGASEASMTKSHQHQTSNKSDFSPVTQSSEATSPHVRKPGPAHRGKPRDKRASTTGTTAQQPAIESQGASPSASVTQNSTSTDSQTHQQSAAYKTRIQAFLSRHPDFDPDAQASQTAQVTPTFTPDTSTPQNSSSPSNPTSAAATIVDKPSIDPAIPSSDTGVPTKKKKSRKQKKKADASETQAAAPSTDSTPAVLPQLPASVEAAAPAMPKRNVKKRGYSVAKFGTAFSSTGRPAHKISQGGPAASNQDYAPKNPNVRVISSEEAKVYKLAAKAKSLAEPSYIRPPPASDVCGFSKLPAELRNQIYGLVFRGLFILDGGWTIRELDNNPQWNTKNAPIFYQVDKSRDSKETKRYLSPIHMRAHTSLMFTCKQIYHEYSQIIYSEAIVAVARPHLIRQRFLTPITVRPNVHRRLLDGNVPSNPSRPALRMPPSWITNMHLKIDAYAFPMIKERLQQRLRFYVGWQKTCQGLAETMTGLKELTLHLAKPTELGYAGPTLVEDCTLAVEPLRDMAANKTKIHVVLKMDWDVEKKDAFAAFLGRWLNGDDFWDCREALMTGKKDALNDMLKDLNVVERAEKMEEPEFKQATKDWDRLLQANEIQPEHLYRSVLAGVDKHGKTFRFFSKKWIQTAAEWEEDPSIWAGLEFM